jgi:hypothetical protein
VNFFFKSIQTCGTLLNRVSAVFGQLCRRVQGNESVVTRACASTQVEPQEQAFDQSLVLSSCSMAKTNPENQSADESVFPMVFSGPACKVEVSFGYISPARGISTLLRVLGAV